MTTPSQTKAEFVSDRDYWIWFQFEVLKMRQRKIAKEHDLSVSRVKHIIGRVEKEKLR